MTDKIYTRLPTSSYSSFDSDFLEPLKIDKENIQILSNYSKADISALFMETIKGNIKMYVINITTNDFHVLTLGETQEIFSVHKLLPKGDEGEIRKAMFLSGIKLQYIGVSDIWIDKTAADEICEKNAKKSGQAETNKTLGEDENMELLSRIAKLLNKEQPNFCPELEAAIHAGLSMQNLTQEDFKHTGANTRIKNFLRKNYRLLITREGKENEELLDRIAKVCTPQQRKTR